MNKKVIGVVVLLFLFVTLAVVFLLLKSGKLSDIPVVGTIVPKSLNITLKSDVSGYGVKINDRTSFDKMINDINYFSVDNKNIGSNSVYHVKNVSVTLTDKQQKNFQTFSSPNGAQTYSSNYEIKGDKMEMLVFVDLSSFAKGNKDLIQRLNYGFSSEIIETILASASLQKRERDDLQSKYLFSLPPENVPFVINKL